MLLVGLSENRPPNQRKIHQYLSKSVNGMPNLLDPDWLYNLVVRAATKASFQDMATTKWLKNINAFFKDSVGEYITIARALLRARP